MIRLMHRTAAVAAICIAAASIAAQAQTTPAPKNPAGLYFIAGTVLNAVTGAPVQSADRRPAFRRRQPPHHVNSVWE